MSAAIPLGSAAFERGHYVGEYLGDLHRILREMEEGLRSDLARIATLLEEARVEGRNVFVMGNGGSGSAASHLACDLNKYTITPDEKRYRCIALTDNIPVMLAIANDIGYEDVFVEQLRNFAQPGDVLIGISGSGNSKNCVKALQFARTLGMKTVTWTGYGGGAMAPLGDVAIVIPSFSMVRCEDVHVIMHHCLVSMLKAELNARHGIANIPVAESKFRAK